MMVSPEGYASKYEESSYEELLSVRDELLKDIKRFENKEIPESKWLIDPNPSVIYQMKLEYLSEICKHISEKYREIVNTGEEQE